MPDILDRPIDNNLTAAGLDEACLVRLKLLRSEERLVLGRLGSLAAQDRAGVTANLRSLFPVLAGVWD